MRTRAASLCSPASSGAARGLRDGRSVCILQRFQGGFFSRSFHPAGGPGAPSAGLGNTSGQDFDRNLVLFKDVALRDILRKKKDSGTSMTVMKEEDTIGAAVNEMQNKNICAVVVKDAEGHSSGLF